MGRAGLLFLDIDTGEGDSLALSQESCSTWHSPFAAKEPPKVSKGRSESPLVASAEAKLAAKQGKSKESLSLAIHKQSVPCSTPHSQQRYPEGFQRATGKPFGRLRRGETLRETWKSKESLSLVLSQESCSMQHPPFATKEPPKVSKGRPESPLVASAEAKPCVKREKARRAFPLPFHKKAVSCERFRPPVGGRGTLKRRFFVKFPHRGPNCPLHVFSGKFPASSVKFFLLFPCLNTVEF